QMLALVTPLKINSRPRPGKAAVFFDPLHQRGHPRAAGFEKRNPQVRVAVGDPFRDHAMESELHGQPKRYCRLIMVRVVNLAEGAKAVSGMHRYGKPGVVCRGPNRLHGRVVDSHISGDAEKHHGYGSQLLASLDFPNRACGLTGSITVTHFRRSGHWLVRLATQ